MVIFSSTRQSTTLRIDESSIAVQASVVSSNTPDNLSCIVNSRISEQIVTARLRNTARRVLYLQNQLQEQNNVAHFHRSFDSMSAMQTHSYLPTDSKNAPHP